MSFDGKAFGEEIVAVVKAYIERRTGLLEEKVAWLQARLDRLEGVEPAKSAKSKPIVRVPTRAHNGNGRDAGNG